MIKHPSQIDLFEECQKHQDKYTVINEWDLHSNIKNLESILSGAPPIRLIVEATDAVHPFMDWSMHTMNMLKEYFVNNPLSRLIYYSVNYYPELENIPNILYRCFPEYHAYYYPLYSNISITDSSLTKKFLCLNKRIDVTRWILYKKFYTDNLINHSFFSFLGEDCVFGNLNSADSIIRAEEIFVSLLDSYPAFNRLRTPEHTFIKIENDTDIDKYIARKRHLFDPSWMLNNSFYQNSFCSVISETAMSSIIPNFSEKTFRAIANGHPFIILGAAGSLQFLKKLGFDTFDDVFDNSYDSISDQWQRMLAIFNTIDKINILDLSQLTQLKQDLLPRRLKNVQVYQELYQRMLDKSTDLIQELKQFINTK